MKLCLVCSSGGHFFQLRSLNALWHRHDRFWVTFSSQDTSSLLGDEKVFWAYQPTNRNIKNLIKNTFLAVKILRAERPDAIISTGAGVAVPFLYMGRLMGVKTIYIESLTRVNDLSLSGKLVYPIVDKMLVQWPQLAGRYKKALFQGQVV